MAEAPSSWRVCVALLLCAIVVAPSVDADGHHAPGHGHHGGGHGHHPKGKCPKVEEIVRQSITTSFKSDKTLAAGLVRMMFHDAFVEGQDASILLDGSAAERTSPINGALHGFEAIDAAKAAVEKVCPGVVSCADILVYATRDLVALTKGPYIRVKGGRLDGKISLASRIGSQIPGPQLHVPELTANFNNKGLSQKDMVVLSGGHTIGKARCVTFQNRLFTFSSTNPTDPNLNPALASQLKQQCPAGQNQQNRIDMDSFTPSIFDNGYYVGLTQGRGFFTSDDDLFRNSQTSSLVKFYATKSGGRVWASKDFPASFIALSQVGVKTGSDGEIRRVCSKVNA